MKIISKIVSIVSSIVGIVGWALVASAMDVNPTEILQQADSARGNVGGLEWQVKAEEIGKEADEAPTTLTVKAKNDDSVAIFLEPTSSKGQKMLMKKNNMWFIKPGVSKPVSISPRQKLMGGASNADIASTNYAADYDATLLGEETVDGIACYVFDLKGKTKKVTYDGIKYWVSVDRNLGVKAEFYSVSGKLLKTASFKYDQTVDINGAPHPFVSEMRIEDAVQKDTATIMTYTNIVVAEIPDAEFSLQN
jgi:hypothetical protein